MANWTITALYFGKWTAVRALYTNLNPEIRMDFPITGFLLRNGHENVLVDTGVADGMFDGADGTLASGFEYGSKLVVDELAREGLTPDDIDKVIYTHLHYDHAGNIELFPNAVAYVQKREIENCVAPYEFQISPYPVYLEGTWERFRKLEHVMVVDGDVTLGNGLELVLTGDHTKGCQAIVVPTAKGRYVLTGDSPSDKCCLFPQIDRMVMLDGTEVSVTPGNPAHRFIIGHGQWSHYDAYDGFSKLLCLAERPEPEFFLPSHWPENILIRNFG